MHPNERICAIKYDGSLENEDSYFLNDTFGVFRVNKRTLESFVEFEGFFRARTILDLASEVT